MNENPQRNSGLESGLVLKQNTTSNTWRITLPHLVEKRVQVGLATADEKVDKKVRSALGGPVTLVPKIPAGRRG